VLITKTLGALLAVGPGDSLTVKVLEGDRRTYRIPIAGLVDELMGLQAHMRLDALSRRLGEVPTVSLALLRVDRDREALVIQRLTELPDVASVTSRSSVIRTLRDMSGRSMAVVTLVLTVFAVTIAVGVVYNSARVALSLRSRDLASLRVLGFTRGEISWVLLGELGVQVLLAIPLGLLFGKWLTILAMSQTHAERYRFPVTVSVRTYAFATLVVLAASVATALIVRRGLDRLDLIGVLKTRE
jgi:putative ABC transport system permease protein